MDIETARADLIARARRDRQTRARLAETGALFEGYHPEMEALHLENAAALETIIAAFGWPDRKRFGEEGAGAAFIIMQHAISRPDLQRRGLAMIQEAVERGDASMTDAAYLADRIAVFEGRPQTFGTQFDWDETGELAPAPIAEPERIDEIRAQIGLPPLAETIASMRAAAATEGQRAPSDYVARRTASEAWLRKVGWRA